MALDTQEKLDKAKEAIKNYQDAVKAENKARINVQEKLSHLKNTTGANNVDEAVMMLGQVMINGLPEVR